MKKKLIFLIISIVIAIITTVIVTVINKNKKISQSGTQPNGTQPNGTQSPDGTQSTDTLFTPPPPPPPPLISVISFERDIMSSKEINLAEIIIYDDQMNIISTNAGNKFISYPSQTSPNVKGNLTDRSLKTDGSTASISLPNEENYVMYGDSIGSIDNSYKPDYVSYVTLVNKFAFIKKFDTSLKMVLEDNSEARYTTIDKDKFAFEIFDPSKWDNYNSIDAGPTGYAVKKISSNPNKQYIKVILVPPSKIRKIVIINHHYRRDIPVTDDNINGIR